MLSSRASRPAASWRAPAPTTTRPPAATRRARIRAATRRRGRIRGPSRGRIRAGRRVTRPRARTRARKRCTIRTSCRSRRRMACAARTKRSASGRRLQRMHSTARWASTAASTRVAPNDIPGQAIDLQPDRHVACDQPDASGRRLTSARKTQTALGDAGAKHLHQACSSPSLTKDVQGLLGKHEHREGPDHDDSAARVALRARRPIVHRRMAESAERGARRARQFSAKSDFFGVPASDQPVSQRISPAETALVIAQMSTALTFIVRAVSSSTRRLSVWQSAPLPPDW